jgi:hypothetical protein
LKGVLDSTVEFTLSLVLFWESLHSDSFGGGEGTFVSCWWVSESSNVDLMGDD